MKVSTTLYRPSRSYAIRADLSKASQPLARPYPPIPFGPTARFFFRTHNSTRKSPDQSVEPPPALDASSPRVRTSERITHRAAAVAPSGPSGRSTAAVASGSR